MRISGTEPCSLAKRIRRFSVEAMGTEFYCVIWRYSLLYDNTSLIIVKKYFPLLNK